MKTMTIIMLKTIIIIVIGVLWMVRQTIRWMTLVIGITMIPAVEIKKTKNRKRNVIWFNPTFCKLFTINIGKYFLRLIDKHLDGNNLLKKIFNRKTIKISYSCTYNLYKIISNHNKDLMEKSCVDRQYLSKPLCNSRVRDECPVGGKCNSENVVYKATIFQMENRKDIKIYFGISTGNWKQRLYNDRHSVSNPFLRNQTAFSKWFWRLKDSDLTPLVRWNFIKKINQPK